MVPILSLLLSVNDIASMPVPNLQYTDCFLIQIMLYKYYRKITIKCMCIKFNDKQSECLFSLGKGRGHVPRLPKKACGLHCAMCSAHQDTTPVPYDHAISEMANQIWF